MNDSESFDAPPDFGPDATELREQQNTVRKILIAALIAMLIASSSLTVFLIPQVIFVGKELQAARPQVNQIVANYQQVEEKQINNFITTLVNFARQHPDFTPILAKYKIAPAPPLPSPPVAAPTTAPPVSPKKK